MNILSLTAVFVGLGSSLLWRAVSGGGGGIEVRQNGRLNWIEDELQDIRQGPEEGVLGKGSRAEGALRGQAVQMQKGPILTRFIRNVWPAVHNLSQSISSNPNSPPIIFHLFVHFSAYCQEILIKVAHTQPKPSAAHKICRSFSQTVRQNAIYSMIIWLDDHRGALKII